MSLSCPVCFKTGFTEISISTHVEYCILRASRAQAKAAAEPAAHVSKKTRLDRDHALSMPCEDLSLDNAATATGQDQYHRAQAPTIPSTASVLSVYQSTTLVDLAALVTRAQGQPLSTSPAPSSRRHRHHQHTLLNRLQRTAAAPVTTDCPSSEQLGPDTVPPQLSPTLRRAFAGHRLAPPPAASVPHSLLCSSADPADNSLYLAFWEGNEEAVSVVYERVLRGSLAALTSPPVYCQELRPGYTGNAAEGQLWVRDGGGGGYGGWTEQDLRTVFSKSEHPSQQQHQQPPRPQQQPLPAPQLSSWQQPPTESPLPPSPPRPSPAVEEGLAVCTREGGGTIRDAVDIDQSSVCPYRLQHLETFHFTQLQSLPPPDRECVAVVRLFGYVERAGERLFGWASLTGRTVEDHDCILAVTKMPTWMATHELRAEVEASLRPPPVQPPPPPPPYKPTGPPSAGHASTPAILASTNCPLCDSIFPAGMALSAREAHVNQCLVSMQGDVFSQTS